MDLRNRSEEEEIMDDLNISGPVIDQTLRELDFINQTLGGNQISLSAFKKLLKSHDDIASLADLGCGGADILIAMNKSAINLGKTINFLGVDANPHIVKYAQQHTQSYKNISIETANIFDATFQQRSFDVIHCCLFLHHFTKEQLVALFSSFVQQARVAVIVNDLHRHSLAYYSIKWLTKLFSKSYMVQNDAALSVARGFKRMELQEILSAAGISNYSLKWRWAFRWQLVITP